MKNIKKLVTAIVVGLFTVSTVGCGIIEKTPEAIKAQVVADVSGEKITRGQLDEEFNATMKQQEQQYGKDALKKQFGDNYLEDKELKKQVLESMTSNLVIEKQAKAKKLIPKDIEKKAEDAYKKQYDQLKETYKKQGKTEKQLKEDMKKMSFSEKRFKETFRKKLIVEAVYNNLTKDVKVSDKEIKDYYDKNQEKYTEKPNKIKLRHILVKTEAEAKKVKERLAKGEKFEALAKELSQDPGSKAKGGELPEVEIPKMQYLKEFQDAALKLKQGEISEPVKTQAGYHVIECLKRENNPVKPLDKVKSEIEKILLDSSKKKVFSEKFEKLKKAANIKVYEKNLINK